MLIMAKMREHIDENMSLKRHEGMLSEEQTVGFKPVERILLVKTVEECKLDGDCLGDQRVTEGCLP